MEIEVGDVVELNNGEVHEVDGIYGDDPDRVDECGVGPFVIYGMRYHQDGRFSNCDYWHCLSVNRIIQKASSFTLENLHVGPGDVVEYDGTRGGEVKCYIIAGWVDGKCYHTEQSLGGASNMNLGSCWRVVRRAPDYTPKVWSGMTDDVRPWKDLTDEEKGALLLAAHEGKVIEKAYLGKLPYLQSSCPQWFSYNAYRVKPEPVRETVTLMIDDGSMGGPQAIGTIELIDGEPDCSSIKMEKV